MFARNVSIRLKANSAVALTKRVEEEAIPALRKQKGFEGAPRVQTYEVANSTFHQVATTGAARS